jgi:DNA-binding NarL/FixJ family response regulator
MTMNILLADNHTKVRSAMRLLLEQEPDVRVVGEAEEVETLLVQVRGNCPDLVLLDWEMPRMGPVVLASMRALCPHTSVVALSSRPESRGEALAGGADAFVSKCDSPVDLLHVVHGFRRVQNEPGTAMRLAWGLVG